MISCLDLPKQFQSELALHISPNLLVNRYLCASDWEDRSATGDTVEALIPSARPNFVASVPSLNGRPALEFVSTGAADPLTEIGKYLWIVRKGPDAIWRISTDIWNSDAPPASLDS